MIVDHLPKRPCIAVLLDGLIGIAYALLQLFQPLHLLAVTLITTKTSSLSSDL
jgi:hypothetical protein